MILREITSVSIILRISIAVLFGGIIGFERGLKKRPAGLRTYMLVCVGSCLIMLTNQYIYQVFQSGDPVRMGAQVVSGIGFLGAGTIVVTKRSQIIGLTTAAGLWAAAAVGLAIGIGFYEGALWSGVIIFLILSVLHFLDNKMQRNSKILEVYVELSSQISLGDFIGIVREMGVEFENIQIEHNAYLEDGVRSYIATLRSNKRFNHSILSDDIRRISGVIHLEEL